MIRNLNIPCSKAEIASLKVGDAVMLSGTIYTARDCAHKRFFETLDSGENLPFDINDAFIYYAGPCPAKEGFASGSCGPTTSARMEGFAPRLLNLGLGGMVGKGEMNDETVNAIKQNKCVYFSAIGGAGAIYGKQILESVLVAYPDLLSEGVYKLKIKDFPVVVAIDSNGDTIY